MSEDQNQSSGTNIGADSKMFHGDSNSCPNGTQIIINNAVPVSPYAPPPPIIYRKRMTFIILGILFGCFGIHNFYIGYAGRGVSQLLLSLILFMTPLTCLPVMLWVFFEIAFITEDARSVQLI